MHGSELAPPGDTPSPEGDSRRVGRIAAIRHIAFVTPGNYAEDDPGAGLEAALRLFETGEALGFDSAWVRSRHLERAISSAATFLAAASQRTRRIRLGTAVIQLGYENPFRLAEDLASVDLLSKGRLEVGVSAGAPAHGPLLGDRLFEGDPATMDFSYDRALRLRDNLSGGYLGRADQLISSPAGDQRARVQPYSPTLAQRLWYGGGSLRSAEWAGRNGFNFLIGNLNQGEEQTASSRRNNDRSIAFEPYGASRRRRASRSDA